MKRPKVTRRRLIFLIVLWSIIVLVPLLLTAFQLHQGNLRELKALFALWGTPGSGDRIVVFAPHCDDETLGAGGILHQAASRGAEVWIVLMTNGDGARSVAVAEGRGFSAKPSFYVNLGYRRQNETRNALKKLGIQNAHVITLGYPDRGLEPMWSNNWTLPYKSPFTRDYFSPYRNSYTKKAPHTGRQVLRDVKSVLMSIEPTNIYYPHPNDQHPDHWATSAFVTEALYDLGWLGKKEIGMYLVHRGDWPVPQGLHDSLRLAPPAALASMDISWYQYTLGGSAITAKREAVEEYKSQSKRFLRSFVRENELFALKNTESRIAVSSNMKVDGKVQDWKGIDPIIRDPVNDGLPAHSQPGADLVNVYAARDDNRLYFRITIRGAISTAATYELKVRPLDEDVATTVVVLNSGKPAPAGWKVAYGLKDIELSCPADKWKQQPVLIAVKTKSRWYPIDRSAHCILKMQ